jgi:hypothetical protein
MKQAGQRGKYQPLLDNLRAIARSEETDWEEDDWRRALRRATAGEPVEPRPRRPARPAWAWGYATAVVILLGAAAVTTRSFFRAAGPVLMSRVDPASGGGSAGQPPQDQLAVSLVSAESGLRVYWYFDREFDWKEEFK